MFALIVFTITLLALSEVFTTTTRVQTEGIMSRIVFAQIQIAKANCIYVEEESIVIRHYDEKWEECTEENTYTLIITTSPEEVETGTIWSITAQIQKNKNAEIVYAENAIQYVPYAMLGSS